MSTGLHARKRISDEKPDHGVSPPSGDDHHRRQRSLRCFSRFFRSEVGCAVEAVIGFLIVGVLFGYFIFHHQHRKVALQIMSDPLTHAGAALKGRVGFRHHFYSGHPKSVTILLPSVVNPSKRSRRLESIFETWGPAARAVYVVHNVSEFPQAAHAVISDTSKPEDPYSYPQLMLVPPNIGVDDGVPRLKYVVQSVYKKINPDFAFFVNDHTFVLPDHLCKYLEHRHPTEDMYHGHALKNGEEDVFNSGAAGYVLSRETMKKLVQKWDEEDPTCTAKNAPKWLQGNPGLVTTKCLKQVLNVEAVDTRAHGKYHRFHAFPLTRVVSGDVDQWYKNKHKDMEKMLGVDQSYETLLTGPDCCSHDTVSFHYVEYIETRALFATREALLKNPKMPDPELKGLMMAEWPRGKDVGGYSRPLPKEDKEEDWKKLLQTMRKISTRQTQREC